MVGDTDAIETTSGFLPGTLIDTPFGPVAIETLRSGELVTVVENGRHAFRVLRRTGRSRRDLDQATEGSVAFPVRIRRHALADNVPSRDLLVTPDCCLHVEGRLVPSRLLVNGASIMVDATVSGNDVVHLGLDRHAILLAEGLEVETRLDAADRGNTGGGAQTLRSGIVLDDVHALWQTEFDARVCIDRAVVEPIRQALAERAGALEIDGSARVALVSEPDMRLQAADGTIIDPVLRVGAVYAFMVPAGATDLRLVSVSVRADGIVELSGNDDPTPGVGIGMVAGGDASVFIAHLGETAFASRPMLDGEADRRQPAGDLAQTVAVDDAMSSRPAFAGLGLMRDAD